MMTNRWREDLGLLDTVEPDVGKLRALAASGPNESPPSGPGPGKRAAIISLSLAVAVLGFAFVFIALRAEPPTTPVDAPNDGLVPSGGTYELSNFEVQFPQQSPRGEGPLATVTFTSRWTSPNFPGEAPCTIRLLDADGRVLTTLETGLTAMMREDRVPSVEIEVPSGIPTTAEGECGPGMIFDGRSQYVFSNLVVEGDRITGDIAWSADTPVGEAACAARVVGPDGESMIEVFTLGAGQGVDRTIVLLPGKFPDSGTAEVRCEPYQTEEQLQEGYWSPWPPNPVPTAEATSFSEAAELVSTSDFRIAELTWSGKGDKEPILETRAGQDAALVGCGSDALEGSVLALAKEGLAYCIQGVDSSDPDSVFAARIVAAKLTGAVFTDAELGVLRLETLLGYAKPESPEAAQYRDEYNAAWDALTKAEREHLKGADQLA
jgi:hypothetical protein